MTSLQHTYEVRPRKSSLRRSNFRCAAVRPNSLESRDSYAVLKLNRGGKRISDSRRVPLPLGHGAHDHHHETRRHRDRHFRFDGQVHNFPFNYGGPPDDPRFCIFPFLIPSNFSALMDARRKVRSKKEKLEEAERANALMSDV